jgi:hypothetical protein
LQTVFAKLTYICYEYITSNRSTMFSTRDLNSSRSFATADSERIYHSPKDTNNHSAYSRPIMLALKNFLSLFTLVASLAGLATSQLVVPILPELDPFYKPDAGFESKAPGTILRTRKIASAYFGLVPNTVDSYQLLYRTTAVDGSAIAAVTTVFKPSLAKLDRFVSFHTAYDGAARSGVWQT